MKRKIKHAGMDAIRVTKNGQVVADTLIIDQDNNKLPHRDAIQIIPRREDGTHNTQFAGAEISGIEIRNNTINSSGHLQGIFCSDGLIRDCYIVGNQIDTQSQHKITLCCMGGHIADNRDSNGDLVTVQLDPLRIGGNQDGTFNVWIESFSDPKYSYEPSPFVVRDDEMGHVIDNRHNGQRRPGDIYLTDFDLDAFVAECGKQQLTAIEMRDLALQFGRDPQSEIIKSKKNENNNMSGDKNTFDPAVELGLSGKIPRGIRNNNPGNLEHSDRNKWLGLAADDQRSPVQQSEQRFCVFVHPVYGIRAMVMLLINYQQRYRLDTIAKILNRYAPRQDNNNTRAYINYVAGQVGVEPNQRISVRDYQTCQRLVRAIIQHENGIQPYPGNIIDEGIGLAGIAVSSESQIEQQKPKHKSTEQVATGTAAGGVTLAGVVQWLKEQQADLSGKLAGLDMMSWIQIVLLVAILGSLWYLAWRRNQAGFLGIR